MGTSANTFDRASLHRLVLVPILVSTVFGVVIFAGLAYWWHSVEQDRHERDAAGILESHQRYFAQEVFLHQEQAVKARLDLVEREIRATVGSDACVCVVMFQSRETPVTIGQCAKAGTPHKMVLHVGERPIGELHYRIPRVSLLARIPSFLYVILLFSIITGLLVEFMLVDRMHRQLVVPMLRKMQEGERSKASHEIARQVAHDIRSPIAALEVAQNYMGDLPPDVRKLVHGSIERIRDIALRVLQKQGGVTSVPAQLIFPLLEAVVREKSIYLSRPGVSIELSCEGFETLSAICVPADLQRVVSNLIDNALEAIDSRGRVLVKLLGGSSEVAILVIDDGAGMTPEQLEQIGRSGFSTKGSGHGIGVNSALAQVRRWGGELEFSSVVGKGTTASLRLPRAETPAPYVTSIVVPAGGEIAVLDDEDEIHRVWRLRFAGVGDGETKFHHFYTTSEMRAWYGGLASKDGMLFLVDHDLRGDAETGLDLIAELGISERSILVTARELAPAIVERCQRQHIRLLPKSLAPHAPISVC